MAGQLPIDHFITHNLHGIEQTNEAFAVLHSGACIRAVVHY
jgi:Zn-dependent alcohol dehydrogenase